MQTVLWSQGFQQRRPSGIVEWRYPVVCECGGTRTLAKADAARAERGEREMCARCQRVAAGKIGFQVTAERHGRDMALYHTRLYQLERPSSLSVSVRKVIEQYDMEYSPEYVVYDESDTPKFLVDFMLWRRHDGSPLAVEVNGAFAHRNRSESDARKAKLLARRGIPVLDIPERDVKTGAFVPRLVNAYYGAGAI